MDETLQARVEGERAPLRAARLVRGLGAAALLARVLVACGDAGGDAGAAGPKVLHLPMRTDGPKSLDPARCATQYESQVLAQLYDTLLQHEYLVRPPRLAPLLCETLPEVSADQLTWTFRLRPGVRFQDDPCFPGGEGREVRAADVAYSWKRHADPRFHGKGWWLFEGAILGFDEYRAAQEAAVAAGGEFDHDAPVAGLRVLGDHVFEVVLKRPLQRFRWTLAMPQLAVVPREADRAYGGLDRRAVGSGPFRLADWEPGQRLVLVRNPTYREELYPSAHMPEDVAAGLTGAAGARLPRVDRVEISMFPMDQPMWLRFLAGELDYVQAPAEYEATAIDGRTGALAPELGAAGIVYRPVPLLDFIFRGFDMRDPLVGGYAPEKRALRQAIACALDWQEHCEIFYNGVPVVYDGMIPPGLDGHPAGGNGPVTYRPADLDRARSLLAQAGYPDGRSLPPIAYYVDRGGNGLEQTELLQRQLGRIGVRLDVKPVDFSQLIAAIDAGQAPMFSFAWLSDYPDAENNLALFYGPNRAPGANCFSYENPEYDRFYERILVLEPGPERTALQERMRDMVLVDCPFVGSMARVRHYLIHPWLRNFKPSEDFHNWIKYMDIDEERRPRG